MKLYIFLAYVFLLVKTESQLYYASTVNIPPEIRPQAVAIDMFGNAYIADATNNQIYIRSTTGDVSLLAGSGEQGFADGVGNMSQFNQPNGIAVDSDYNVYVADSGNHVIRKIDTDGLVSLYAGTVAFPGHQDGIDAKFNNLTGISLSEDGHLFIADTGNHMVRKIDKNTGFVSTVAGTGTAGFTNGVTNVAQFRSPRGIAVKRVNGFENVYVADTGNHVIRMIDGVLNSNYFVFNHSGSGEAGWVDGDSTIAQFYFPTSIAVNYNGDIYVADSKNYKLRLIKLIEYQKVVTTIAGSDPGYQDGIASDSKFTDPTGIAFHYSFLIVLDFLKVRKLSAIEVTSIAWQQWATDGGERFELNGYNFNLAPFVVNITINGSECSDVTIESDSRVSCLTPPGDSTGHIPLIQFNQKTLETTFTFDYDSPQISSIGPPFTFESVNLTILGHNFGYRHSNIQIHLTPQNSNTSYNCSQIVRIRSNLITCKIPQDLIEGRFLVSLFIGSSSVKSLETLNNGLTPTINSITLNPGADLNPNFRVEPVEFSNSGYLLTLNGTNFGRCCATISIGDEPCSAEKYLSDNSITCNAPEVIILLILGSRQCYTHSEI